VITLLAAACIGYVTGTALAFVLDGCYTDAPLLRLLPCKSSNRPPAQLWAGTIGYFLATGRGADGASRPTRFCYLPLIGAVAAVAITVRARDLRHLALLALFSTLLAALTATDFERHLLPNRLMYPALALALALGWAWPGTSLAGSVGGGLVGLGLMFVWSLIDRHLGFGDVKLATLLGFLSGISQTLPALAIAAIAGGLAALFMLVVRKAGRKSLIAYGPYLALGAFAGMLLR
jgi:leader peptidase (prepilin peptidase) / N-methyltransferase